ncbi:hypothetical protein H0H87_011374, partial [Tephrocybe sp. NHM501043]
MDLSSLNSGMPIIALPVTGAPVGPATGASGILTTPAPASHTFVMTPTAFAPTQSSVTTPTASAPMQMSVTPPTASTPMQLVAAMAPTSTQIAVLAPVSALMQTAATKILTPAPASIITMDPGAVALGAKGADLKDLPD